MRYEITSDGNLICEYNNADLNKVGIASFEELVEDPEITEQFLAKCVANGMRQTGWEPDTPGIEASIERVNMGVFRCIFKGRESSFRQDDPYPSLTPENLAKTPEAIKAIKETIVTFSCGETDNIYNVMDFINIMQNTKRDIKNRLTVKKKKNGYLVLLKNADISECMIMSEFFNPQYSI